MLGTKLHVPATRRPLVARPRLTELVRSGASELPRLVLARLRSRADLVEVRAADLRFTPGESETFSTSSWVWISARTTSWSFCDGP